MNVAVKEKQKKTFPIWWWVLFASSIILMPAGLIFTFRMFKEWKARNA